MRDLYYLFFTAVLGVQLSLVAAPAPQDSVPLRQETLAPSLATRLSRALDLTYELGIRELWSVWQSMKSFLRYTINSHKYNLNPPLPTLTGPVAKVIILLPGQGGGPFCFLPLAKQLQAAGIPNVYSVAAERSKENSVPIEQLQTKIRTISEQCRLRGAESVEVCLVGHSLGALIGTKYIWRGAEAAEQTEVTMMISLSGRLRYLENPFSWFCEDVREEIELTFEAISKDPHRVPLYTLWGDRDRIVPEDSAHIQGIPDREFSVEGYGHGGLIHAPQAHEAVTTWITEWLLPVERSDELCG